jgi:hypothetical protein
LRAAVAETYAALADDRLLSIYLNDHLAGSAVLRSRCRFTRERHRGTDLGAFLDTLLGEIDEDRFTLRGVMDAVGARESKAKAAAAAVAERAGRLKPNGRILGYSPLSRLLELELMSAGIEGKRLLWLSLHELGDPRLAQFDFAALAARAQAQRDGVERYRLPAARAALYESK